MKKTTYDDDLRYFHDRIHSDLLLEAAVFQTKKERWTNTANQPEPSVKEFTKNGVEVTEVCIETEEQASYFGREKGHYITLYTERMRLNDGGIHREISELVGEQLMKLVPEQTKRIFLVGLGNAEASPDALGPDVIKQVHISHYPVDNTMTIKSDRNWRNDQISEKKGDKRRNHTSRKYSDGKGIGNCRDRGAKQQDGMQICALIPGVMAQTGLETAEILKAVAERVRPDVVVVVDALAAGSVTRLGTTIQITDTGIAPGSGIGNHRQALNQKSLGIPVIAIGIPLVVEAAAIIYETIDAIRKAMQETNGEEKFLGQLSREEQYQLFRELLEEKAEPLYVTVKDIDELEKRLAFILSEAINGAFVSR